jgi:(2Fe-2S) ferredoxin
MHGSAEMRDRMKRTLKERGLKGTVIVTGTSCLGYCPAEGCAVGFYPEGEFFLSEVSPEAEEEILARALKS